jgi:aryl-phospho-beta-D-glucosidase BglC (GH1 family)
MRTSQPARFAAAIFLLLTVSAPSAWSETGEWWSEPYPQRFDAGDLEMTLDPIRVEGNRFVDPRGETVIFKGVSIGDPDKLDKNGRWSKELFREIKDWGANLIRVPVHPVAWRARGSAGYFELLDQALVWATELELYLMIDWHTIGNLQSGLYQHPMYDTTGPETHQFWRSVALRYQGVPTIAFYELFNEPTVFNGTLGEASWEKWKAINEELITIIYAHDQSVIPLVAGFNWAYDLKPVAEAPIEKEGIGYVSHPYPQKVEAPFEEKWERDFGFVADRYPVFVTEFGYTSADAPDAHVPVISSDDYPETVIGYFEKKGISWAAWCFDPDWGPHLISDWEYTPTESGAFFRAQMQGD